ncbi:MULTISPECIES: hypothetical protein [unclassified Blastomonas]|uniref:hypothetical protein n=2 Tax=Blastomonas TaxID=150203 RepID=UPI000825D1A5|nr:MULTISPECIES: hypothetical protein [unclassified Blastomonas]
MTDKHELIALAERVEALTGPCHETDKAILAALGYTWRGMGYWADDDSHQWCGTTFFTKWLDAAMTLVPVWLTPTIIGHDREVRLLNGIGLPVGGKDYRSTGSTLPNALTAAALRALAERERQQ